MRRPLDKYYTPKAATLALLDRVQISGDVLECCAGTGAIAGPVRSSPGVRSVALNDVDPLVDAHTYIDATLPSYWDGVDADWVVTNPPYSCCQSIIVGAFRVARRGVAMLLRLSYLEPCNDRAEFLAAHPPRVIVLPRISFTDDGKADNVTSAWFVWDKSRQDSTIEVVTKAHLHTLIKELGV